MAEIDKLTLEIEDKASSSSKGIDDLVNKLQNLDDAAGTVVPKLTKLSGAFVELESATRGLRNINFNKLNNAMNQLSKSFNKIEHATKDFDTTALSVKNMSSAMNSLMRSMNKLSTGQETIGNLDLSKLTSQNEDISKLATMSQSLIQLKDGAKAINTLVKSLENMNKLDFNTTKKSIEELSTALKSMKTAVNDFSESTQNIKLMASAMNSLNKALEKLSKSQAASNLDLNKMNFQINKYAGNIAKGSGFAGATDFLSMTMLLRQAGDAFGYLLNKSNDYIETMNLFSVVMGKSTEQAWDFVQSLESIGVDQEQAMRFQSSFYDIGKSLGVSSKNAYTLSEQFTKLSYDYSSLYNLSVEESFQKLQAAIVGTTEPIRRLGKDISMAKLEEVALNLGIEESVRNMTQAEKAELRFIAVMQQSTAAMNDMERTINSPANALRILKAQFVSLARELGNLFIPALQAVLPWVIALTKFLRGIVADIANFFGITFNEIDFSGINSQLGQSDAYTNNLANNLGDSAKNAKKLKDYMLGIDELNVLNPDTGAINKDTGASGAGIGGGLGVDLADFGYEEVLKNVQSKADEILKIFEKWKTPLLVAAGILAGLWTVGKIYKFIQALRGIHTTSTILSGVQGLGKLATSFFNLAGTGGVLGTVSTAFVGLGDTILTFLGITTGSVTIAGLVGFSTVLAGVALAGWGIYEALQPAVEQVDEFANVSEETKSKLEPLVETWKGLDKEITKLDWSNKVITSSDVKSIKGKTHEMVESVLNEVSADRNQALKDIEMLQGIKGISPETYQEMMGETNKYYDDMQSSTKNAEKEINSILEKASSEKRALKDSEVKRLKELEEQIRDNAVTTMTESEEEQMKIMTRLKHNQEVLQVETASEMLKEAKKNHDDQVSEAEDWRTRMLMQLDQRFGDEATMSNSAYKEQYDAIQAAYNDQVSEAKKGYDKITEEVRKGLGNQKDKIDYSTGEIKANWKVWLDSLAKGWNSMWSGLKTWWDDKITGLSKWWGGITSSFNAWKSEMNKKWTNFWGGLKTWYQNTIDNLGKWWNGISSAFDSWKKGMSKKWDSFWDGLGRYKDQFEWSDPSTWISWSSMSLPVDYTVGSVSAPEVTAFARGGFVPANSMFVPPNTSLWTAGEAGREVIGNFRGRSTVMPLEDTGFVQAMYRAVYQAAKDASGNQPITITVQPQVKIGSKEIKQAQEEYEFDSGGSLIRKK